MLSRLQLQVAEIVAGLAESADFALAGGAALIVRGDVRRQTRDLDFFGLSVEAVDRLLPAVEAALGSSGLSVESEDDRTEVDLAADARLFPAEPGRPAPLLSREELAVDKVLAIFGRAEARDFVDLMALEGRFGLERLCRLAAEKDGGFTPGVFAQMLIRFDRLRRDEFELDDVRFGQLAEDVRRWRAHALNLARGSAPEPGQDPGRTT